MGFNFRGLFFKAVLILCPVIGYSLEVAQAEIQNSESLQEPARQTSRVKFRGFQNAQEDLPNMSDNWKVSFFQLAAVEADRLKGNEPASLYFYNYFSFNYKLSDDERIAVRPVFEMESPGRNKYNDEVGKWLIRLDDLYVSYSRFNLFEIGPFGTRANFRVYAPTSEASQNSGLITQLHPEFYMETSLGRNSGIEFQFKGDYFVNSKRSFILKTPSKKEIPLTNKETEWETIVEYKYRAHRLFHLKPRVSWLDEWYLSSPENNLSGRHTQEFSAGIGLEWRPTRSFNTTLQFSNVTKIYDTKRGFKRPDLWLPENNEIVALTNYRF